MTHGIDYKDFQKMLNKHYDKPITEEEAAEAYHNLGEFFTLLVRVNEREEIVPMEELTEPPPNQ